MYRFNALEENSSFFFPSIRVSTRRVSRKPNVRKYSGISRATSRKCIASRPWAQMNTCTKGESDVQPPRSP